MSTTHGGVPMNTSRIAAFVCLILLLTSMSGGVQRADLRGLPPAPDTRLPGRCGLHVAIDTTPALPTPDDAIQVVVSGDWSDSCVPSYQSHHVVNNVILVDTAVNYPPGTACLTVITPWRLDVEVGNLPAGSYLVHLYITDLLNQLPTTFCASRSFTVAAKRHKTYLPVATRADGP